MFVRIKTSKNSPKKGVQIVECIRQGASVKQRIVRHVGTAFDDAELTALKNLAEHIKAKLEEETQPALFQPDQLADLVIAARAQDNGTDALDVNMRNIREEQRITTGIHEIFSSVYADIGFDNIISVRKPAARRDLRHITMARIAHPSSKRQSVIDLAHHFGIELSLSAVYRMMDALDDSVISKINTCAYTTAKSLLKDDIQVAFYDCTTLYFESFTEDDDLLKNGYSKDMKFNQPQLILALLSTTQGLPIGYKLYAGNTFEGKTLKDALDRLQNDYAIKRVVFVADSALLSKENIALLEEKEIEYIVGARLKRMGTEQQEKILDETDWITNTESDDNGERYKEISFCEGQRTIITYRPARAKKDKADRDKTLQKLISRMKRSKDPTSLISNYGYKRFINVRGDAVLTIDEDKVASAARWDGIHGIVSNVKNMSAGELRAQYRSLWEIEECFRISKHDLKFRPVFHWTKQRVQAHVALCFMSLVCVRYLQHQLKTQGHRYSIQTIIRELCSVQTSVVKEIKTKKRYAIPSAISEIGHIIYKRCNKSYDQVPYPIL